MNKGVTWFKMLLDFAPLINAVPSVNAGEGLQASMRYFKTGEEPDDDFPEMSKAVYTMLKTSIDQAFTDCEEKSEKARKSINARWHPDDTDEYDRIRPNTEKSQSQNKKENKNQKKNEESKKRGCPSSVSVSVSDHARAREEVPDTDADARLIAGYLHQHGIKISMPEVADLIAEFDMNSIFWMIGKTDEAHAKSPTSYFLSVCDDKRDKGVFTIDAIRRAECDSPMELKQFDAKVRWYRNEFEKFKAGKDAIS